MSVVFEVRLGDPKTCPVCPGQQQVAAPWIGRGLGGVRVLCVWNLQRNASTGGMWRGSSFEIWGIF